MITYLSFQKRLRPAMRQLTRNTSINEEDIHKYLNAFHDNMVLCEWDDNKLLEEIAKVWWCLKLKKMFLIGRTLIFLPHLPHLLHFLHPVLNYGVVEW